MPGELVLTVFVKDEHGKSVAFSPGDDVPLWAARRITNPGVWAGGVIPDLEPAPEPEPEPEPEVEVVTYAGWTVARLRDEIDSRNRGRDKNDRIPADGIKTELVAALEADDQT